MKTKRRPCPGFELGKKIVRPENYWDRKDKETRSGQNETGLWG